MPKTLHARRTDAAKTTSPRKTSARLLTSGLTHSRDRRDESAQSRTDAAMPTGTLRELNGRGSAPVTALAAPGHDEGPRGKRLAGRRSNQVAVLSPPAFASGAPTRSETQLKEGRKERTAMRNVGLDLGRKEVSFCEVSGNAVVARRTTTSLEGLRDLLGPGCAPAHVAIEACREAWHVHDVLTEWGNEVLLVDTTRARQIGIRQHGRKTDRLDAEALARAVERGGIALAHVLSPERRELREKLSTRRVLVQTRAELIVTMRGLVRARGKQLRTCSTEHFGEAVRRAALDPATRATIDPLMQVLMTIDPQLSVVETTLEQLCSTEPVVAQLTTAPGVSLIVAAAFVSVVDEAKRFRNAHQLESYLGLVPCEDTSGGRDKRRLGAITKCGNPYLRSLLVQAAWCILRLRHDDPLRSWGENVARRRGKRVAAVALARRLAGVLWAMWRHERVYDPALVGQASSRGLHASAVSSEAQARAMANAAAKAARRLRTLNARLREVHSKMN